MKISISNIAWDASENDAVAGLLQRYGVGVDLAPSKIWTDPLTATTDQIAAVRRWWAERAIPIVGAQSLHFGHPELQLFKDESTRQQMFDFTARMIALCGQLGATAIVFGSPHNRQRGSMPMDEALSIATDFFSRLGDVAAAHNTYLCLEPNAVDYGCDFITTAAEGAQLVQRVNHPSFRLHLDAGNMVMMGEDSIAALKEHGTLLQHFHLSEPQLAPVGVKASTVPYSAIFQTLEQLKYQHWVAIEMKNGPINQNILSVQRALDFITQLP